MKVDALLSRLDAICKKQCSAVLLARTAQASEHASEVLGLADDIRREVRDQLATERDETAYTIQGVIDRLQRKVNVRPSVSRDPVASDNLRLAIRALRTVIEPAPADSEPIDIFIF